MSPQGHFGFLPGRSAVGKDGRPIPKIIWKGFRVGDIQNIPADTSNKKLMHSLITSYYAGARRRLMRISCSIAQKPGHIAIWRVK